ncbi:thiol-disulfide oxidoreductase DCC family protein [Propionicimonas sp.]|uniref:thiol-disulfide oxidoreductase DCC family protein n=1 Tax=Propionicimonas sp. TaxID=1955623 RepID=UPI0039E4C724
MFDGDCAFCTTSVDWLARRLHRHHAPSVRLSPWQYLDLADLGITTAQAQREVIWVSPDGSHVGGAGAVAAWLVHAGPPYSLAGRFLRLPLIRSVAAGVYRLVAANRHRLPGGSPACALPPHRR